MSPMTKLLPHVYWAGSRFLNPGLYAGHTRVIPLPQRDQITDYAQKRVYYRWRIKAKKEAS
jgi:hypothetical protein